MKFCPKCGIQLEEGALFCKMCGFKLNDNSNSPAAESAVNPNASVSSPTEQIENGIQANEYAPVDTAVPYIQTVQATQKKQGLSKPVTVLVSVGSGVLLIALAVVLIFVLFINESDSEEYLSVDELLARGDELMLDHDYREALLQFLDAIEINPVNPYGYIRAADVYIELGIINNAIIILEQGLERTGDRSLRQMLDEVMIMSESKLSSLSELTTAGDLVRFGIYDWRVLDVQNGKALVITDKIVENRTYHSENVEITWAASDIRAYLNSDFYYSFNESDREKIEEVRVTNNNNPWFETMGGVDTQDRIFLLSLDELVKYFGDSGQVSSIPSDGSRYVDDQYNDARIAFHIDEMFNTTHEGIEYGAFWWLRSPGSNSNCAATIDNDGDIDVSGDSIVSTEFGIRPVMWLKLS